MFGKSEWFTRVFHWGLVPNSRQGWIYATVWAGVVTLPALLLWWQRGTLAAVVWLVASVLLAVWEGRSLLASMESAERKNLFFIGEEDGDSKVATRNFDLHVRD